jgi:hypothetical protein
MNEKGKEELTSAGLNSLLSTHYYSYRLVLGQFWPSPMGSDSVHSCLPSTCPLVWCLCRAGPAWQCFLLCVGTWSQTYLPTLHVLGTKSATAQQTMRNLENAVMLARRTDLAGAYKPGARNHIFPVLLDRRVRKSNSIGHHGPLHRTHESPSIGPSRWLRRVVGLCHNF